MGNHKDNDSKLLELAPKAAGVNQHYIDEKGAWWRFYNKSGDRWSLHYWNPITDDGDALRLAVKLKMDVDVGGKRTEAIWNDKAGTAWSVVEEHYLHNGDALASTRRAIVRAAAEIGKAMP